MSYFKPLRRKLGFLTLVMACMLMAGWLRSLCVGDELSVGDYDACYFARSFAGLVELRNIQNAWGNSINWQSFSLDEIRDRVSRNNLDETLSGFKQHRIAVSYSSIVIPLTLLSAYLLLSKPRTIKDRPTQI